jgi:hypothetical protein
MNSILNWLTKEKKKKDVSQNIDTASKSDCRNQLDSDKEICENYHANTSGDVDELSSALEELKIGNDYIDSDPATSKNIYTKYKTAIQQY